ncbi:TPA: TonB-dependent receptor plug domain-containing protein, partial [Haemophilus influenzae]
AETVKTAKTLEREQANNIKDIVKYETGVTVVEAGRFGQSGFAIRGVDENRVAITVDGVAQAETLSSQGLKTCLKDMVILITRVMELKLKLYLMPKLPKVQILSCLVVVHWVAPSSIKLKMQEIFCLTKTTRLNIKLVLPARMMKD